MINLAGHALESLANHSGFKKADTLATKQKLVHVIGKGSMYSPYFI
jgi:deoxyxylulose-5-phosphate synthase